MEFIKSPDKEDAYVWFKDKRTGEDLLLGYERKSKSIVCFSPECVEENSGLSENEINNKSCPHVDLVFTERRLKRRLQSLAKIHIPSDLSKKQQEQHYIINKK